MWDNRKSDSFRLFMRRSILRLSPKDKLSVAAVALLVIWVYCSPIAAVADLPGQVKPTSKQSQITFVDFPPTPPTLSELVRTVDLVVFGRITATSPPKAVRTGENVRAHRLQELTVLEVLKGEVANHSSKIIVRQIGGTVTFESREYSVNYPVKLVERGDVVLLFLNRVGDSGLTYDIAYGSDGIVWSEPEGQRMPLPPGLQKMPELNRGTFTAPDLLAVLRQISKKRIGEHP
jgi:hypothetical protein